MKGDFTRNTFRKDERFSRVLQQQGRVQLDADWNEQGDIEAHLRETGVRDIVGPSGAPMDGGGFRIEATMDGRRLTVSPGRLYIDGLLCELAPGPVVPLKFFVLPTPGLGTVEPGDAVKVERWSTEPETFTLNLPGADVRRLGIGEGDAVKLLFQDSLSIEDEAGPYSVWKTESGPDDRVAVTFGGSLAVFTQAPRFRRETTTLRQPDLPGAADPSTDGIYLVYLDVWARHLTWLDEPEIRETALGGPDTATRVRTVCQARFLPLGDLGEIDDRSGRLLSCLSKPDLWSSLTAPGSGRLRARAQPEAAAGDPCIIPAGGGFTGLENQLYRVEIHTTGDRDQATFKWSRENGSVITRWVDVPVAETIRVADPGRDAVLGLHAKDWVELIEDDFEADGRRHGLLVQLCTVQGNLLTLPTEAYKLPEIIAWFKAFEDAQKNHTTPPRIKVRRWDGATGAQPVKTAAVDGWIPLEQGVQVRFEAGSYLTGDYWTIPARTFIGNQEGHVEWPLDSLGEPLAAPPHGIEHHYAKLAIVERAGGTGPAQWTVRGDCRDLFPPLTGLLHLEKVCGDCQEALPGETLEAPLRLAVLNGGLPMPGQPVRVKVTGGRGSLSHESEQGAILDLTTASNGTVECFWTLGDRYEDQHVEAWLLDKGGNQFGPVLCFTARQSVPVLVPLCGQGQKARPGEPLPTDLAVAVRIGSLQPLANALLRFQILDYIPFDPSSFGRLEAITSGGDEPDLPFTGGESQETPIPQDSVNIPSPSPLEVRTGADGIAQVRFYLGKKLLVQRVRVELVSPALLDKEGKLIDVHTCFTATLSVAREVAYDSAGCKALQQAGAFDVQKAIDELCRRLSSPAPPRFFVQNVLFASGGEVLNDSLVTVDRLTRGLRIICTAPVAPESVGSAPGVPASFHVSVPPKPTCYVTLAFPWFVDEGTGMAPPAFGFQPVILQAEVSADKATIRWAPTDATRRWLMGIFSEGLRGVTSYLQVCLTLEGNFIWTPDPKSGQPKAYLAGEALGKPGPGGRVDFVRFPAPLPEFEIPTGTEAAEASAPSAPLPPVDRQPIDPLPQPTVISGNRQLAGRFRTWFWIQAAPAPTPGTQPETPAGVPGPKLEDVQGLGPVMIARLRENGIFRPSELVALDLPRATEILGVPEARVQRVIENARRLLGTGESPDDQ